jgi:hypothetical protein
LAVVLGEQDGIPLSGSVLPWTVMAAEVTDKSFKYVQFGADAAVEGLINLIQRRRSSRSGVATARLNISRVRAQNAPNPTLQPAEVRHAKTGWSYA